MDDGDDDDEDEDLLDKQTVERDNFDAGLPRLLCVAVDSHTMRTSRNLDWCSLNHFPRKLSPW